MKKRWIALGLAAAMAMSMTACTSNTKNESGNSSNTADKKFTVGICQLATHPALDAATKGFRDPHGGHQRRPRHGGKPAAGRPG